MLKFLPLTLSLLAVPAAAQDVEAWFVIINQNDGRIVDEAAWNAAVAQEGLEASTRTVIDTDFYAIDRTIETAKTEGGTVAFFLATNVPTTDPAKFDQVVKSFLSSSAQQPLLEGLEVLLDQPECRLIRKPLTGREFIYTDTIVTMDSPQLRQDCYAMSMRYMMNNLEQFGPRTPFDQQIDENAAARQDALPPMAIKSQALVDEAARQPGGPPVRRASNVYKTGERISLHANLLNVGRYDPGTSKARYEINMDLVVTRLDEPGEQRVPSAFVYKGQSTHRIPVPDDYFDNFITAGFALPDAGKYRIELVLTDLSRPGVDGAAVTVPYEVEVVN
ncbi:hypothetical protein SAMN05444273_103425 [Litoreibacter ascidiaceicola]|uniref:Uncharacterized protein n=1 Tax=Litoreibacter ascidiaceicola TaxID=1486859 RepID=A0A1M4Y5A2_9RHOB|nr:hypothetical protein [Litoreibacter ascidiaceicola]SHF00997.1 hypothetical protein SAMN05444273_103425 [Litoreibacter ascidiaceicola]